MKVKLKPVAEHDTTARPVSTIGPFQTFKGSIGARGEAHVWIKCLNKDGASLYLRWDTGVFYYFNGLDTVYGYEAFDSVLELTPAR